MKTPSSAIMAYLQAKDGNRPHLLAQAFTDDALLEMLVRTAAISFPPGCQGREAIAEVLVRRFGQSYENVYTFCLSSPPEGNAEVFGCDWLVAMTEKGSRAVRVGCGRYDWCFSPPSFLAESLSITIEAMQTLPASQAEKVMDWAAGLPYPWCPAAVALPAAPDIQQLAPVLGYIGRAQTKKSRAGSTHPQGLAPPRRA